MNGSAIAIGMEHLTVQDMPPGDFIDLASRLGCGSVSLQAVMNPQWNPFGFPFWSLVEDRALRRDVGRRMADSGIVLALGEGAYIAPDKDVGRYQPELDTFAELGARRVNLLGTGGGDRNRECDQAGQFAKMAAERGMQVCIEFAARGWIGSVADLVAMLDESGAVAITLLIDPMHFFRLGQDVASLADVAPDRFAYLQLCDVPRVGVGRYFDEALYSRLPPGEGELPLEALVAALPDDLVLSLELPQVELAKSGVSHYDRLRPAIEAARALVARARSQRCQTEP